ncbi:LysR family transcriptional regulator [Sporomusa acidovorans]|uniref:HTH-type transcriptional regulator HdfR n=1 Tax=Sporomusa acidovorans (strain ATCC 49682 / DSM 3132 / Mol) TaxID=1123286 RepID=A0ABZ3JA47_SPOA4|nr:LysR family transcriptional regulator [Sporomusa acidovorans]OZC22910.1 HTH-type transcriptional regulator TfdS [Sporomusa acidovorans DSM 3132]SDE95480.1 DNA-binding transcriptional regulator, LysR family [Sporomusa acidovorans]
MEIRQLKYFLAIAEAGQITKAAARLHITQPPLSQQMILLEKELGVQLIERTKKHITLTESGYILQNRAEQILELIHTTMDEIREAANGISGKLTIGTITSSGRSLIPEFIQKFHQTYPKISFDVRLGDSRRILELLNAGVIEIGLVRLPIDISLYNYISLPQENMVIVALPDAIKSEDKETLSFDKIKNYPLLIHRRYETIISDYCSQAGFEPNVLCTSDDTTSLLIWAKLGLGIAIVPETTVNLLQDSPLLVQKPTSPAIVTVAAVIWLKKHTLSTAAAHFLEMFKETNAGL